MTIRNVFLVFSLVLGIATTATAQSTTDAPTAADLFPVTPAVPQENQVTTEKFGDWEKRCIPSTGACVINFLARDTEQNPVAEINIQKLPSGSQAIAGATVISPLGTLLTSGIRVQVDGGRALQYPFIWCTQQGCFSRFGLTKESLDSFKFGAIATITIFALANQDTPVLLNISLNGFTAAYDSLPKE
jgi:invasion protein IalB